MDMEDFGNFDDQNAQSNNLNFGDGGDDAF